VARASQTVENYLKAIFQAQMASADHTALIPLGHVAAALSVVPGTATTMVKALAESGLARYEPYAGVRLTAAGTKLAALVLRRHRLVELFLVQVMGMSWTEVHDEAENLEHAVSDRLIERMDEMLGHPTVDPHGDPIPGPEGTISRVHLDTLLTCPLHAEVAVRRLSDQDGEFLRFAERHNLKPGQVVTVDGRDSAADSVHLTGPGGTFTIGARAASKILVQAVRVLLLVVGAASAARAQGAVNGSQPEPFQIADNSFLVEEAFNQEKGVFQNIFGATRGNGQWAASFTQEWPLGGQTHQFSYTLAYIEGGSQYGFGDTLINYRYQAMVEGPDRPAFSPRASLVIPTGSSSRGRGDGSLGLQVNLPFSKQRGDWYFHWNAGVTWLPRAKPEAAIAGASGDRADLISPFIAGSGIYRLRPMLHLMLESVLLSQESVDAVGTSRDAVFTISPGMRTGWNFGDRQLVAGVAVPVTWGPDTDTALFLYLSYELPFQK
jgi:DtxR family transcriptional regulator, Mn-dependent transcriptional regulator